MNSKNFSFLQAKWPDLASYLERAESYFLDDRDSACLNLRKFAEGVVRSLFTENDLQTVKEKGEDTLSFRYKMGLSGPHKRIPPPTKTKLENIWDKSKPRLHHKTIPPQDVESQNLLQESFEVARWLFEMIGGGNLEQVPAFHPPKPNLDEWLRPGSDPDSKGVDFIGRTIVFQKIDSFLASQGGTLLIEGEPGRGKSTVLREFIKRNSDASSKCDVIKFFFDSGKFSLEHLVQRFIAKLIKLFEIDHASHPLNFRQSSTYLLQNWLVTVLREQIEPRLTASGRKLIFVIDALDEARGSDASSFLDQFSRALPWGAYLLVTARPQTVPEELHRIHGNNDKFHLLDLEDEDETFKETMLNDASEYVARETLSSDIPLAVRKEIVRVSAGNFLVLKHLCERVSDGNSIEDLRSILREITGEQTSLGSFYSLFWNRLRKKSDPESWDEARRILGLLATCRYTRCIPIDDLILRVAKINKDRWERLLEQTGIGQFFDIRSDPRTVEIYHLSFREFILKQLGDAREFEQTWADFCSSFANYPHNSCEREYALRFLVPHTLQSQGTAEAIRWITDLDYLEQRWKLIPKHENPRVQTEIRESFQEIRNTLVRQNELPPDIHSSDTAEWSKDLLKYCRDATSRTLDFLQTGLFSEEGLEKTSPDSLYLPDTSHVADQMVRTEQGLGDLESKDHITRFLDFERFERTEHDLIAKEPNSFLALAANCTTSPILCGEAIDKLKSSGTAWLKFEEAPLSSTNSPLVSHSWKTGCQSFDNPPNLRFSADSRRLLVWGDEQLEVWDAATGSRLVEISGVKFLDVSADGRWGVGVDQSGLRIWDLDLKEPGVYLHKEPADSGGATDIVSARLTPDGRLCAAVNSKGQLTLWDTSSDELIRSDQLDNWEECQIFIRFITFNGSLCRIIRQSSGSEEPDHWELFVWQFMAPEEGGSVLIRWDDFNETASLDQLTSGLILHHQIHKKTYTPDQLMEIQFAPDSCILTVNHRQTTEREFKLLRCFNLGEYLDGFRNQLNYPEEGFESGDISMAIRPDGAILAVAVHDQILLLDLAHGVPLTSTDELDQSQEAEHEDSGLNIRHTPPDNRFVTTHDGKIEFRLTEEPSVEIAEIQEASIPRILRCICLDESLRILMEHCEPGSSDVGRDPYDFWHANNPVARLFLFPSEVFLAVILDVQLPSGAIHQIHAFHSVSTGSLCGKIIREFPRPVLDEDHMDMLDYSELRGFHHRDPENPPRPVNRHDYLNFMLMADERVWIQWMAEEPPPLWKHHSSDRFWTLQFDSADTRVAISEGNDFSLETSRRTHICRYESEYWHKHESEFEEDLFRNACLYADLSRSSALPAPLNLKCRRLGVDQRLDRFPPKSITGDHNASVGPDGFTVAVVDESDILRIFNFFSGEITLPLPLTSTPLNLNFTKDGDLRFQLGKDLILRIENFPQKRLARLTTPIRRFSHVDEYGNLIHSGDSSGFSKDVTAICPHCGCEFKVEHNVLKTIRHLNKKLQPAHPPSLYLGLECWSDNYPLVQQCPFNCSGKWIRLNPYVVDYARAVQ